MAWEEQRRDVKDQYDLNLLKLKAHLTPDEEKRLMDLEAEAKTKEAEMHSKGAGA